jgi:hypothetical protein
MLHACRESYSNAVKPLRAMAEPVHVAATTGGSSLYKASSIRDADSSALPVHQEKAMKRQTWTLAGALCAGLFLFNAPIAAQSSMGSQSMRMTEAQVTAKLQAAGYTKVRGVEHEGDHFDADAMKDGRSVHVHVDAKTGAIKPANKESEEEEGHEAHEHP